LDPEAERAAGFRSPKVRCSLCCLKEFCAPDDLARSDIDFLKTFVKKQEVRLRRGEQVYRQGDPFRALVAVHTGSFKLCVASSDGTERVTGFTFAGDLMGLDAIDSGRHGDYAVALEPSGVCLLPWDRIEEAGTRIPLVRRQVMRMLSRELRRELETGLMRGHLSAEQRVAAFLLGVSRRLAERGFDGARFRLPMSRPDIASFLGLNAETVSRLLTRFHERGWIRVDTKVVGLVAPEALETLTHQKSLIRPEN
jgi:CRP/FNR family transcriptional regulator